MDTELRRKAAGLCISRGIGFAYFCQGEETFLIVEPGGVLKEERLPTCVSLATKAGSSRPSDLASRSSLSEVVSGAAGRMADEILGSEDDYAFRLYHALRLTGYTADQLSLETYFGFANTGGSRMQDRPDLCVFDASVCGNFNLYRQGKRSASNDALKVHALRALVEVKGSVSTARNGQSSFVRSLEADIQKLANWKVTLDAAASNLGICRAGPPDFVLAVFDPDASALSEDVVARLEEQAERVGVDFVYRHLRTAVSSLRRARVDGRVNKSSQRSPALTPIAPSIQVPKVERAARHRLHKLTDTPRSPRDLATYFAAILSVTEMDSGEVFPLRKFLSNLSSHLDTGRIESVPGGHRLTDLGRSYFEDRYRHARGGSLDRLEVQAIAAMIKSGGGPGWVSID